MYRHLRVVCEPTAGFERPLLRMARSMGFLTSYVGGKQVHKARVIDYNDTGKTDPSDTGVMLTLAAMGKVLTHRILPPHYQQLCTLNRFWLHAHSACAWRSPAAVRKHAAIPCATAGAPQTPMCTANPVLDARCITVTARRPCPDRVDTT